MEGARIKMDFPLIRIMPPSLLAGRSSHGQFFPSERDITVEANPAWVATEEVAWKPRSEGQTGVYSEGWGWEEWTWRASISDSVNSTHKGPEAD